MNTKQLFIEIGYALFRKVVRKPLEATIEDIVQSDNVHFYDLMQVTDHISECGNEGVLITKNGKSHNLDDVVNGEGLEELDTDFWQNTLIVKSDSQFMQRFYEQISEENANFVKENVRYIVFSPDILNRASHRKGLGDLYGASISYDIIVIDTQADDYGIKNPKGYISTIGHEALHERDEEKGHSRIVREKMAYERQVVFLEDQIKRLGGDTYLEARLDIRRRRIYTADFLLSLGSDVENVVPMEIILAEYLLRAELSGRTLVKYANQEPTSEIHEHLVLSSQLALIAKTKPRKRAIEELYSIVANPQNADTYLQVSAASALHYLAPKAMIQQTTADIRSSRGKGVHLHYGEREKINRFGQVYDVGDGYRVSGVPPLDALLRNKKPVNVS